MLTVGVPKEKKPKEKRVGLVPKEVAALTAKGIHVLIEKGAGVGSGFDDPQYEVAGAKLAADAKEIYAKSGIVQKVKEPVAEEFPMLREGQILFCYLHLASPANCELAKALIQAKVTAVGYEVIADSEGRTPLLKPMSEIAGALSSAYAAYFRSVHDLVRGHDVHYPRGFNANVESLAANYPEFPDYLEVGKVVIYGGGVAGHSACRVAESLKGDIALVEKDPEKRKTLEKEWASRKVKVYAPEKVPQKVLEEANVLIGAVHRSGFRADHVFDETVLQQISADEKKTIMDVAIDQGGNFPESRPATYDDPLYIDKFGNLRFCVANIPSLCGKAASEQISSLSCPYTLAMAEDVEKAWTKYPELWNAVNVHAGEVILKSVKEAHKL